MHFDYELSQIRTAELIRQAENERLVREVRRGRRQAAARSAESESHTGRPWRQRFLRTA